MREDDASYCRRRSIEEQVAAQKAKCQTAQQRHDQLAVMYRFRAAMLSTGPECWADVLDKELAAESIGAAPVLVSSHPAGSGAMAKVRI